MTRFWTRTWSRWVTRAGNLAAVLDGGEVGLGEAALAQGAGQEVGGRDRVLDGEVDADAADRRHGVRRVADAQQARAVPASRSRSTATVSSLTSSQLVERRPPGRPANGTSAATRLRNAGEAAAAELVQRALGDDVAALPVVAAVDHDEDAGRRRSGPACRSGSLGLAREAEPQHVHRRAELADRRGPARSRTVECRPSAPTTRSARISSGPSGSVARTPTTRPPSSIRSVASALHQQVEAGVAPRPARPGSRGSPTAA